MKRLARLLLILNGFALIVYGYLHFILRDHARSNVAAVSFELNSYKSVLVVVPGIGNMRNLENLFTSLSAIKDSLDKANYGFDCIVYVWKEEILNATSNRLKHLCRAKFNKGMWTHHMKRTPSTNASHVAVLIDDIDASKVDVFRTLDLMERSGFDGASPASYDRTSFDCMRRRDNCLSHRTDFVNFLFTIMKTWVWNCFQSHINVEMNDYGWGMDICFSDLCNASLGIIDNYTIFHPNDATSSYDYKLADKQMRAYINSKTGHENIDYYTNCIIVNRTSRFSACTLNKSGISRLYSRSENDDFRRACMKSLT